MWTPGLADEAARRGVIARGSRGLRFWANAPSEMAVMTIRDEQRENKNTVSSQEKEEDTLKCIFKPNGNGVWILDSIRL
jgi:hypothetical protein